MKKLIKVFLTIAILIVGIAIKSAEEKILFGNNAQLTLQTTNEFLLKTIASKKYTDEEVKKLAHEATVHGIKLLIGQKYFAKVDEEGYLIKYEQIKALTEASVHLSLDEETKENIVKKLEPGKPFLLTVYGEKLALIFDKEIELSVNKTGIKLPSVLSKWQKSFPVNRALKQQQLIGRDDEGKLKVSLDHSIAELKLLENFWLWNDEKRKEQLTNFDIGQGLHLLKMLHLHNNPEGNYTDYKQVKSMVEKKISHALTLGQPVKAPPGIKRLILEDILKKIMRPYSPKGLYTFTDNNILRLDFDPTGTKIKIEYKENNSKEVRSLASGEVFFYGKHIPWLDFDPTGTKIRIKYNNDRQEIINLINQQTLFYGENISWLYFDSTGTKIRIKYNNNRGEVIDLTNQQVLFQGKNISWLYFDQTGTKLKIIYNNNKNEVRNLANQKILFSGENILLLSFDLTGTKIRVRYINRIKEIRDLSVKNEKKQVIFFDKNASSLNLVPTGAKIIVKYKNNNTKNSRTEVRDLSIKNEQKQILFYGENITKLDFDQSGTKLKIKYKNGEREIRNLETRQILFYSKNILVLDFDKSGTKLKITYKNGDKEVRNLETRQILFYGKNILDLYFDETGNKLKITYKNGRREVRDLTIKDKNKQVLFSGESIRRLNFDQTGTKIIVHYIDNNVALMDLEDYDRGIEFTKLGQVDLLFLFRLRNIRNSISYLKSSMHLWHALDPEIKNTFYKFYLTKEQRKIIDLEKWYP